VIALKLGDNKVTARLADTTATAARKNPLKEARKYAYEEWGRVWNAMEPEFNAVLVARQAYKDIWGGEATAKSSRVSQRIRDLVLPAVRAWALKLNAQSTDSPAAAKWLSAQQKCADAEAESFYQEWVEVATNRDEGNKDKAIDDQIAACTEANAFATAISKQLPFGTDGALSRDFVFERLRKDVPSLAEVSDETIAGFLTSICGLLKSFGDVEVAGRLTFGTLPSTLGVTEEDVGAMLAAAVITVCPNWKQ